MEGHLIDFRGSRHIPATEIAERVTEELAEDAEALLTTLGVSSAAVVGIDAGATPAFLLAASDLLNDPGFEHRRPFLLWLAISLPKSQVARSSDPEELPRLGRQIEFFGLRYFLPISIIVFVAGVIDDGFGGTVRGLRVVDASIMPKIVSGNTASKAEGDRPR